MAHSPALHVVLGAGQIGNRLARLLLAEGHRVRQVRRQPWSAAAMSDGVERIAGDITDLGFATRAGSGAAVIYDCMNPPYHRWPELLLPIGRGSLHAAATANARLVALDCLYMYGRPDGPMREDSPPRPCSKKGELRVQLAALRLAADREGKVPIAIGRASDFFGPDLQYSLFNARLFQRLLAGRRAECFGDPDLPHAFTYADDVARALATLGRHPHAFGRVWHLPTAPATSQRDLITRLGHALGCETPRVLAVPRWLMRTMGVFSPMMRELVEMLYQFEVPFELDDTQYRSTFGEGPTPLEASIEATAAWARVRFGLAANARTDPRAKASASSLSHAP